LLLELLRSRINLLIYHFIFLLFHVWLALTRWQTWSAIATFIRIIDILNFVQKLITLSIVGGIYLLFWLCTCWWRFILLWGHFTKVLACL